MPVRPSEKYYSGIGKQLESYFYNFYWKEILTAAAHPEKLYNAKNALLDAIRRGTVRYQSGEFSGQFNIAISRELSRFAKYDSRRKVWRGIPPADIIAASAVANERGRKLAEQINRLIADIPARVEAAITNLHFAIDSPLLAVSTEAGRDLKSLGIGVAMTPELSARLLSEYTENMDLNIKGWTEEQIERLRQMIQQNALSGYNPIELKQLIESEFGVTMNKARFLARQETTLFVSAVRDERYREAGIRFVKWSSSHDNRVVGNPAGLYPEPTEGHGNHFRLNGKICRLDDPSLFADTIEDAKAGKWKSKSSIGANDRHAGTEYGCRCTYIPIII